MTTALTILFRWAVFLASVYLFGLVPTLIAFALLIGFWTIVWACLYRPVTH